MTKATKRSDEALMAVAKILLPFLFNWRPSLLDRYVALRLG